MAGTYRIGVRGVSLVAQGATNWEVAEHLYLSLYTVNSHLRHAFTKLGIRIRVNWPAIRREGCRPNVVNPGDTCGHWWPNGREPISDLSGVRARRIGIGAHN